METGSGQLKIGRFARSDELARPGLVKGPDGIADLGAAGVQSLTQLLECSDLPSTLGELERENLPIVTWSDAALLPPIEQQEVWAAGVTYLRSKAARMEESDFGATAYDKVYEAKRPELFFKSLGYKVVGPGQAVGIRRDAAWSVPEPELALVFNSKRGLAGCTVGVDMSSRDIEGENLLYLPQAKIYDRACALGPWITVATEEEARSWHIELSITRAEAEVFHGKTGVNQMRRSFAELADFLFRSQTFPAGAVLLTGTGIVPPDAFKLKAGDLVRISITGIGMLEHPVVEV